MWPQVNWRSLGQDMHNMKEVELRSYLVLLRRNQLDELLRLPPQVDDGSLVLGDAFADLVNFEARDRTRKIVLTDDQGSFL